MTHEYIGILDNRHLQLRLRTRSREAIPTNISRDVMALRLKIMFVFFIICRSRSNYFDQIIRANENAYMAMIGYN